MASPKILEQKQQVVEEITAKLKESSTVILFDNKGLSVSEIVELRRKLRNCGSEMRIYKNTLLKRAFDSQKIDLGKELAGPKEVAFGTDAINPVKVLFDFAKEHPTLEIKIGYIDGAIVDKDMLSKLAQTPSRDTLLTMFAAGLLEHVKNVAVCLDLHSKKLEN